MMLATLTCHLHRSGCACMHVSYGFIIWSYLFSIWIGSVESRHFPLCRYIFMSVRQVYTEFHVEVWAGLFFKSRSLKVISRTHPLPLNLAPCTTQRNLHNTMEASHNAINVAQQTKTSRNTMEKNPQHNKIITQQWKWATTQWNKLQSNNCIQNYLANADN